ncbi:family 16 glycoside hydrolase [Porcipelethomonas sp.]|uniref:family 16 glycoside hydrolase n=1 Tax=Porcipelethomonas sp. TaxID=2981675 RepID=UPI003EF6F127
MNNVLREIVIDGNLYGNSPACRFRGLGAVISDSSSGLLADYKMKQPEAYQEITELLFRKNYGAGLSHIRVEYSGDVNLIENGKHDITGNSGFILAADATKINPDITVEFHFVLPENISGNNSEEAFEEGYKLCRGVLGAAFEKYGLKADYISFGADKSCEHISGFIKYLSNRLKNELLANYDYSKIKTAVYDTPEGIISSGMLTDEELRNAVSVIGYGIIYSNENIKLLNEKYHKEIWYCDGKHMETVPEFSVNADGTGITGKNSLTDMMDNIIFCFNKYSSMYEYDPAVSANFSTECSLGGLVKAETPWSGHYSYDAGLWGAAHITHFTEPGWKYAVCESGIYSGEYAAFISDDGDYTVIFVNDSDKPRKYNICVRNTDKSDEFVHCVETRGPEGCDGYSVNWFRVVDKIMPAENADGCCYTLEVKPFSVMTCTTMPVDNVNGTESVKKCGFVNKVLPLPYTDNFNYSDEISDERNGKPFYSCTPYGKFEIISAEGGKVLVQNALSECCDAEKNRPSIILGDDSWADYSVRAEVKFDDCSENNYLGVGLRYNRSALITDSGECGYQLRIYSDCRWQLRYMDEVLEEETSETIMPSEWNQLKISAQGRRIRCYINRNLICEHIASAPIILSGRACLYSAYHKNMFRNFSVSPVIGFSSYSVNYDCLCGKFTYSEGWTKNISADPVFHNYTSVSNSGQNEYFEFEFSGETVSLTGRAENLRLKVEIDNKIMTAGLFIAHCGAGQVFYSKENLGDGVHRLKLTVLSGELEFDSAGINVSSHLIAKGKIGAAITDKTDERPVKKLKKSTLMIGIGLAAAGAFTFLLGRKVKKRRSEKKKI